MNGGGFVECEKTAKRARPYVDFLTSIDEDNNIRAVYEKEILEMLDIVENREIQWLKDTQQFTGEVYTPTGIEFINYNDN